MCAVLLHLGNGPNSNAAPLRGATTTKTITIFYRVEATKQLPRVGPWSETQVLLALTWVFGDQLG